METIEYRSILDLPVLTSDEDPASAKTVSGVKMDFEDQRVKALVLSDKGRPSWEIPPSTLAEQREEAIIAPSREAVKPLRRGEGRLLFGKQNDLIGATVTNSQGLQQGTVDNFWFLKSGTILFYELSRGWLRDLLSGKEKIYPDEVKSVFPRMLVLQH
ncbi:MAG TPA: hypothetical protein ENN74_03275 [Firmicutes bacterium]|nr:hypothetical protein [Bacillota bacterium]